MPTTATVADVEDLLDRTLTNTSRVERLIERAEGIVAGDMPGLTFELGTETVTLEGDGDEYLVLPKYPVTAVSSVTINDVALASSDYSVDTLGRLRRRYPSTINPHNLDEGTRGRWPDAGVDVVVVYSYGWGSSAVPAEVTAVVAELTAARTVNPEQITQQSIGDRSQTFSSSAGAGDNLTDGQRYRLCHWRRNRVASARVRS